MISAAEAGKLARESVVPIVSVLMQEAESKIKQESLKGQTTCYIYIGKIGWEVCNKLKELLIAEGYEVTISGKQEDTARLTISW